MVVLISLHSAPKLVSTSFNLALLRSTSLNSEVIKSLQCISLFVIIEVRCFGELLIGTGSSPRRYVTPIDGINDTQATLWP